MVEVGRDLLKVVGAPDESREVVVSAQDVRKSFGRLEVLRGVSLEVKQREVVLVIGPSGSGKTTFLRCINHLEKINGGTIRVNGHLIGYREENGKLVEEKEKEIARQRRDIGFVFQRFNLFPHKTALENVTEAPIQVRGQKPEEAREVRAQPARAGRAGTQDRLVPGPAMRRPAAARRDCAGAGHAAGLDALR